MATPPEAPADPPADSTGGTRVEPLAESSTAPVADPPGNPLVDPAGSRPDPLARLRRVALACLYVLVIAATLWVFGQVLARLSVVVVPLAVALLVASLFAPAVTWLHRRRVPRGLATAAVLLGGLAAVGGLI